MAKQPRKAILQAEVSEDFRHWVDVDRKTALRALELAEAVLRDPVSGVGTHEPLKYLAARARSRRLTRDHRRLYLVREERIDFLQARYHH